MTDEFDDGCEYMYVVEGEIGCGGVICRTYEEAELLARRLVPCRERVIHEMPVVTFRRAAEGGERRD